MNHERRLNRYFRNISPFIERKDWKIEFPTYCGIFSSKYLTIVAKIRGVLETRGDADEDEVGGLDRIAISPSLPYLL